MKLVIMRMNLEIFELQIIRASSILKWLLARGLLLKLSFARDVYLVSIYIYLEIHGVYYELYNFKTGISEFVDKECNILEDNVTNTNIIFSEQLKIENLKVICISNLLQKIIYWTILTVYLK